MTMGRRPGVSKEHLRISVSSRGFSYMPELDVDHKQQVRVYESNSAEGPYIWLKITTPDGQPDGFAHIPVDVAKKLADQINYLCDNHYQFSPYEERP